MAEQHPFRFGVIGFGASSREGWIEQARRAETLGYSTFSVGEHVITELDAGAAMAAAAMVTTDIRIGSLTVANDLRNPVMLARMVASLDVLSGGRFEFGFGSGFYRTDYDWTGVHFDSPPIRLGRFMEAVRLVKAAFIEESVNFAGEHYAVSGLSLKPKPLQRPWPPLLIGGGGKRVLQFAAREADIVSVNIKSTPEGGFDWASISPESTAQKFHWVREAAGDRFAEQEVHWLIPYFALTDDPHGAARAILGGAGAPAEISPEFLLASPQALIGSEQAIVDMIQQRRESYGVNYLTVFPKSMEAFAPIAARLAGT
jgi:probable F420-dependent oxidoreductase